MYSRKLVLKALRLYRKCGSVTKTIIILGYPSRESMYLWIKNSEYMNPGDRIDKRPPHKCHLSIAEKEYAVKRCFYDGESVKSVSEELGCSTTGLYLWRDKYLHWYNEDRIKESLGYMSPKGYRASRGIAV